MKSFKLWEFTDNRTKYYKEITHVYEMDSSEIVGWMDGKKNQLKRFDTLLDIGVKNGDTILDFGCGVGHMIEHINDIGLRVNYTGIDLNKDAIRKAKTAFMVSDIMGIRPMESPTGIVFSHGSVKDIKENYDWILASGVFNYKFPKAEMIQTVNELLNHANKGIAFNLLEAGHIVHPDYTFYKKDTITHYFNNSAQILENYGVDLDLTVYIRKNES